MSSGSARSDLTRTIRWYHAALRSAFHPALLLVLGVCCAPSAPRLRARPEPVAEVTVAPNAEVPDAASEVAPWLAQSRNWPMVGEGPLPSAHLGRLQRAEIRVTPAALQSYLALVTDTQFAEGTWLVEFLKDARTGAKGPIFALERRASGWAYWELDPRGRVRAEGALFFCAGCHAGAPAAPVFGLPRAPQTQESNAAAARSLK